MEEDNDLSEKEKQMGKWKKEKNDFVKRSLSGKGDRGGGVGLVGGSRGGRTKWGKEEVTKRR